MRLSPSGSSLLLGSKRFSNIRALYPPIEKFIEEHIQDAIFDYVPTMCWDFKVLKFGVISLSQLLDENKHLSQETRSKLFQTFVAEPNFRQAFELLPKEFNLPTHWVSSFWSEEEFNEESFKKEMRKTAALVSDSQFLQNIESTDDEDLLSVVQISKALAQTELSSSIEAVVEKMTHGLLEINFRKNMAEVCRREVLRQVWNEEKDVLKSALVKFIREINKKSVGRQHS